MAGRRHNLRSMMPEGTLRQNAEPLAASPPFAPEALPAVQLAGSRAWMSQWMLGLIKAACAVWQLSRSCRCLCMRLHRTSCRAIARACGVICRRQP